MLNVINYTVTDTVPLVVAGEQIQLDDLKKLANKSSRHRQAHQAALTHALKCEHPGIWNIGRGIVVVERATTPMTVKSFVMNEKSKRVKEEFDPLKI